MCDPHTFNFIPWLTDKQKHPYNITPMQPLNKKPTQTLKKAINPAKKTLQSSKRPTSKTPASKTL